MQGELDAMQDFAAEQATRDQVKIAIKDFLWDEVTGLPGSYAEPEIEIKADAVFAHLMMRNRVGGGGLHA